MNSYESESVKPSAQRQDLVIAPTGIPSKALQKVKRTTLPEGWSIICPNRIKEQRLSGGFETVADLQREMKVMSYARLGRLETGKVFVRDTEYELIADTLKIPEADLRLPVLSQEEVIDWKKAWETEGVLPEGGDKASVILAAYIRYLCRQLGASQTNFCRENGFSSDALKAICHAERQINHWPDRTISAVFALTEQNDWSDVIKMSKQAYKEGRLKFDIDCVTEPRARYEPVDPDKRAPWTFEKDPFRKVKPKKMGEAFYTQKTALGISKAERGLILERRLIKKRLAEKTLEKQYKNIAYESVYNQLNQLRALFPHDTNEDILALMKEPMVAATVITRARLARIVKNTAQINAAAKVLGITAAKVRNIITANRGRLTNFVPKPGSAFQRIKV